MILTQALALKATPRHLSRAELGDLDRMIERLREGMTDDKSETSEFAWLLKQSQRTTKPLNVA